MKTGSTPPLASPARRWRVLYLLLLPAALFAFAQLPNGALPAWVPFATSCGAITGLPCIFCGVTRAISHLLHGEFSLALYYNWLAFPLLAGAGALYLIHAFELLSARNLLATFPRPRLTRGRAGAFAAGFVLLWVVQAWLAVAQHKTELLNPLGPLYSLVGR
ncbi:MAG: DUF2752 domain-containing protein [Chthoniobacterales bacterium]|jgi:hypothetical protein|nr:DUF2752 domain-containing protein [Chthoniobacterales bacterium]